MLEVTATAQSVETLTPGASTDCIIESEAAKDTASYSILLKRLRQRWLKREYGEAGELLRRIRRLYPQAENEPYDTSCDAEHREVLKCQKI